MVLTSERNTVGILDTNVINLQIGNICCAFRCHDDEICNRMRQLYGAFLTEQPPDITIELEGTDRLSPEKLETSISKTRFIRWRKNFTTTHRILSGKVDTARRFIKIKGEKNLCNPELKVNLLNRLMSLAYYMSCKYKYDNVPPAMFVHTCGILRHGQGMLFTGPSGIGKTTVAYLCSEQDGMVMNDEALLVSRPSLNNNKATIQSSPMMGDLRPLRKFTAPLRCIFLLKQGSKTAVHNLNKSEAYLKFIRQIISPPCIGQKDRKTVYGMLADFTKEITELVPVYELEFTPDRKSFWLAVEELELGGK